MRLDGMLLEHPHNHRGEMIKYRMFVNHSSYVNFDNNVAFNVVGASFVTEAFE